MKFFLSIILAAASVLTACAAFDRAAWMEKRRHRADEAARLRAAYTNCIARLETPAEDVNVSLETFPDGSVKTVITAKCAQFFLDTGFVWAQGVVLKKFKKDGSLDARIDAENCVIDRQSKAGWSDGPTKVVHGDTTISGAGVYFSSPESYVRIYRESDLRSKNLKTGGLRP